MGLWMTARVVEGTETLRILGQRVATWAFAYHAARQAGYLWANKPLSAMTLLRDTPWSKHA